MEILFGLYTLGSITPIILLILLMSLLHSPIKSYIHKWRVMKPIPGMEGAFPFIGNALQFKTNAGGKVLQLCACHVSLMNRIFLIRIMQGIGAVHFIFVCHFKIFLTRLLRGLVKTDIGPL